MFIAALLVISQKWKQPRCPLKAEWIQCDSSQYYYSEIWRNEQKGHKDRWQDIKGILLSERNQLCNILEKKKL